MKNNLPPVHPGEYIKDALEDMVISQKDFAGIIGVAPSLISDIVNGRKGLSDDLCVRLPDVLGSTAEFWKRLQSTYDLKVAEAKPENEDAAAAIKSRFEVYTNTNPHRQRIRVKKVSTSGRFITTKAGGSFSHSKRSKPTGKKKA